MFNRNRIELIGNVGQNPETGSTTAGSSWARMSVATNERWKDSSTGEMREQTEWHQVVFWGNLAEVVSKYIRKGSHVLVEGTLKSREYEDKSGIKRRVWEVRATTLGLLDRAERHQGQAPTDGDDVPPGGDAPF